jgi:glutamate synthase (ferredoxin)
MTGGRVVVLGKTGRNFAAGMSGGIAYVLDLDQDLHVRTNYEMVMAERLVEQDDIEIVGVKEMITKHAQYTNSSYAQNVLNNWDEYVTKFVKLIPKDYKRMLEAIDRVKKSGLTDDEAVLVAFEENMKDLSRVGGN